MNTPPLLFGRKGRNAPCALSSRLSLSPYAHGAIGCGKKKARKEISLQAQSVKKVEVQEALLPLNRRRDYCRSPRSFRDTPAGR